MKTQLEITDEVYVTNWYNGITKLIIDKVTPTLAISGNQRFKRLLNKGQVEPFPRVTGFHRDIYDLPNGKIELDFEKQQLLRIIRREIDSNNITLEKLRSIKEIL